MPTYLLLLHSTRFNVSFYGDLSSELLSIHFFFAVLGTPLNGVLPMIEKRVRSPADNLTCSGALQTHQRDNLVAAIIAKSGNLHLVRALLEQGPSSSHWLPVADKISSPADIISAFVDSRLRLLHYTDARAKIWTEAGIAAASFFEWGFTEQLLLVAMLEYIEKSVGSFKVSGEFVDRELMNNIGMNVVSFMNSSRINFFV